MKINKLGPNQTELELQDGKIVFFSYRTPVAALVPGRGWLKTRTKYSVTTSKHVNQWLKGLNVTEVDQSELDGLVNHV